MEPLHTPLYAALLGGVLLMLQIVLMLSVGTYRSSARQGVGIGDDNKLERLVRRHGNLAENAAIFVVVLALYELIFGQTILALGVAVLFFAARLFHAIGFGSEAGSHLINAEGGGKVFVLMRMAGALFTAVSGLALGLGLIISLLLAA